jgi:uncharacterized protein YcfJ
MENTLYSGVFGTDLLFSTTKQVVRMSDGFQPDKVFEEGHAPGSSLDERAGGIGGAVVGAFLGGSYGGSRGALAGATLGWVLGEEMDDRNE